MSRMQSAISVPTQGTQRSIPSFLTAATRIALLLNGALASIAVLGFLIGFAPHAPDHPLLARRVAAGHLAGVFIFGFVASRLRRDPPLIPLPLVFVGCNLVASIYELASGGTAKDLPPLIIESVFFTIYAIYAGAHLRARGTPGS
jgi:hypothetical protein